MLITKAIYDARSSQGRHLNRLLETLSGRRTESITWDSFNWDCIFEASFYYTSGSAWLTNRHNPSLVVPVRNWHQVDTKHTCLKLHGGVNFWYEAGEIQYLPFGARPDLERQWSEYEQGQAVGHPVILAPSYYKYEDRLFELLKPQWKEFVAKLSTADLVIIIGYSLPEGDANARTAMLLGFQANQAGTWIVIDSSPEICAKYRRLLGTARLRIHNITVEDFNVYFDDILGREAPDLLA